MIVKPSKFKITSLVKHSS